MKVSWPKIIAIISIIGLSLIFVDKKVFAAGFTDQILSNTTYTTADITTGKKGAVFMVGSADILLANVEYSCNFYGENGCPFTVQILDENLTVIATNSSWVLLTNYRIQSIFTSLPRLKAGQTYYVVVYGDGGSYDFYKKSVTTPVQNSYLVWLSGYDGSGWDNSNVYAVNKLQIYPTDRVTIDPSDWFKDYYNFNTQLFTYSVAIICSLLISIYITILIK